VSEEELAKDLGPLAALTIGVGTMIGAGIFVLPGDAISATGSLAVVSFLLGGGIALLTAFSASELGTAMPKSGGAYYYVNQALGPLFGSVAGWANWLGLAFASAFYMVGFGRYVANIAGFSASAGVQVGPVGLRWVQVIGLIAAALFVAVNYVGAKETGRLQNVIVVLLVVILAIFTAVGALGASRANLPASQGLTPMLSTTGLIFVSYLGFVQITSVAEEIRDPGRNLPRAVIGSVLIVSVIYALVLVVMSAAVEKGFIDSLGPDAIAVVEVGRLVLGPAGAVALLVGGLLATASSANASILASSRINFAMGRDRIVSPAINAVHPRFGTPYRSIALTGGLILAFIVLADVNTLAKLGSVLHLVIYALLNGALVVMREADVEGYDPEYEVPLYPFTPVAGAATSLALIAFISPTVIAIGAGFVAFAVAWYLLYARTRVEERGALADYVLSRAGEMPGPAVDAAAAAQPDGGEYRVMVALADPAHERELISFASAVAAQRGGTVDAVHVVTVPDQTDLNYARDNLREFDPEAEAMLERARDDAETFGVDVETHTVLSHRALETVFDTARQHRTDLLVMGWGDRSFGGRAETGVDEVTGSLPCDVAVFKDRGFDPERLLVPTAGGPDSELAAALGAALRAEHGSDLELLYVRDDESQADAEAFLAEWAADNGLDDAELRVEDGDVEAAIQRRAAETTLLLIGATERGLLRRLVGGSLVLDVVDDVGCSVVLAETADRRPLLRRLFGRR